MSWVGNVVDNPVVVQFVHRWLAFGAAAMLLWLAARTPGGLRGRTGLALALLLLIQIALGIATLLTGVDIVVAVLHQVNGALLVIAATVAAHQVSRRA
jgi:cytochrome c oxidase assembly protein subunit 15